MWSTQLDVGKNDQRQGKATAPQKANKRDRFDLDLEKYRNKWLLGWALQPVTNESQNPSNRTIWRLCCLPIIPLKLSSNALFPRIQEEVGIADKEKHQTSADVGQTSYGTAPITKLRCETKGHWPCMSELNVLLIIFFQQFQPYFQLDYFVQQLEIFEQKDRLTRPELQFKGGGYIVRLHSRFDCCLEQKKSDKVPSIYIFCILEALVISTTAPKLEKIPFGGFL